MDLFSLSSSWNLISMARAGVYGARSDAGALDLTISSSTTAICMPKKQRIFIFFVGSQKNIINFEFLIMKTRRLTQPSRF